MERIDLGEMLPKNSAIFYDDVHFTDKGSLLTADIIFKYLNKRPPFMILC